MPPHLDQVRPLGPSRRANAAHRAVAAALGLLALFAWPVGPLLSIVLFIMALAVVLDRRGVFGAGRYRAFLAFVTSLWLGLAGVVTSLLGSIPDPGNFLLAPGLLATGVALALLAWSSVTLWRTRRGSWSEIDG